MRASHSSPVLPARISPSAKVPIQIAAGVSPRLARRDRRGVLTLRLAGLAQFRSAALAGADLIAGAQSLAGLVVRAIGARVERVFAVSKMIGVAGLHASEDRIGAPHEHGILTQGNGNV